MNVNQIQSFMQLQALKTLQSDPGQTQMPGGQESNAQASFQSLLQDFLGGSELSRLPLSISALMGTDPSTAPNTQYARTNPYLSAIAGGEQLQAQPSYANDAQLNTANGIGNVLNNSYTPPLQKAVSSGSSSKEINQIVSQMAQKHGVPEKLIHAVIKQESGYRTNAVSHAGTLGLMQLMPSTAKSLGVNNAFDAAQNIEGGTKYIKQMLQKYNGNVSLALAAYNAGSGNVDKYGGIPPFKETQNYVKKITAQYFA
ncbi:lytic transglycosylase domain-containing protein [Bacillus sp. FSL K6-2841]|uniref:lytic transglycosylase domain-containing protein n=1 Tax=unclassified Bacillus (in: firmicutes) TaxID=185979 RepID=UPI0030CDA626